MARPDPVLDLLGLAARAGALTPGTEAVRDAVRVGRVRFALVASDASANTRDKLVPLLEARGVPFRVAFGRAELGAAVGRAPLGAVALTSESFAARVRDLIDEETRAAE